MKHPFTLSALIGATLGLLLSSCADVPTLLPQVRLPAEKLPHLSAKPLGRFFCEEPILKSSLYTFSNEALEHTQATSLFWFDPKNPKFQLLNIRNSQLFSHSDGKESLLFQADTKNTAGNQPLLKTGVFLGTANITARTTQTQLLSFSPKLAPEALRLAIAKNLELRPFGVLVPSETIALPTEEGYRIYRLSANQVNTLEDQGFVACPPSRCWNPELRSGELWFTTLDPTTHRFRIQTFSWALSQGPNSPAIGSNSLPSPQADADQLPIGIPQTPGGPSLWPSLWIEKSDSQLQIGFRQDRGDFIFNLETVLSARTPETGEPLQFLPSPRFSATGGLILIARRTQLDWVELDIKNNRAFLVSTLPLPQGVSLSQVVFDDQEHVYATLSKAGPPTLYKLQDNLRDWTRLTQTYCDHALWRNP